jgi:signal transduction histidine kinase
VGTLAGGIAHNFNNLLMGVQGYVSLMLFDIDSNHPNYENLKRIEEQARSGAGFTSQLLAFARKGKYEVRPADLNARTKKEIKIYRKYQQGIWPVELDRGQIEQALLNLYINAWQAMPGGKPLSGDAKYHPGRRLY